MRFRLLSLFLFFLLGFSQFGYSLDVPSHTGLVIDQTGTLSDAQQAQLESSLEQFQQQHGPQIQLFIIPELKDETIETYSIKVADTWKLGDAKRDDGVILLIAKNDRKLRIEVGQGLEGTIPDIVAGRIVNDIIVPHFKQDDFAGGVFAGLQAIAQQLGGELQNVSTPVQRQVATNSFSLIQLLFFIFIILISLISRLFRRRRSGWSSGYGFFGGGSFGGGGGGFSGGGGGGFSGGGASGGW